MPSEAARRNDQKTFTQASQSYLKASEHSRDTYTEYHLFQITSLHASTLQGKFIFHYETKKKLDEMVQHGVIFSVSEATEWCNGMVPILKLSGDVRVCVDLTGLNKAVRREISPMPAVDESIGLLGASKTFSKLDANSGF